MIIYKAENKINGKVYIGKTIQPFKIRKNWHINNSRKNAVCYFQRAIQKYGEENFEWSILTETDSENKLNFLEKFYIAVYKKMTQLYNLTDGGEGLSGYIFSEESRKKIGDAQRGEKGNMYGKKQPFNVRQKISKKLKGENAPHYGKHGKESHLSKPIYQIDKNTNEIVKQWENSVEAEKELKISHVSCVCRRQRKISGNFKWCFVEDYINQKNIDYSDKRKVYNENHHISKSVYQINKNTNEIIKKWNSVSEAENTLKISHISCTCLGKRKSAGGFKWEFSDT
jgi:group I intron endonuclease